MHIIHLQNKLAAFDTHLKQFLKPDRTLTDYYLAHFVFDSDWPVGGINVPCCYTKITDCYCWLRRYAETTERSFLKSWSAGKHTRNQKCHHVVALYLEPILQSCNTHCSQHQAAHSSNVRAGKHTAVLSVAASGHHDTAAAPGDKDVEKLRHIVFFFLHYYTNSYCLVNPRD